MVYIWFTRTSTFDFYGDIECLIVVMILVIQNVFVIANGQCTSLLHIIMFYDKKVNSPIFTNAKYIYRQWPKVFLCLRISLCISYKTMVFQIIILRSIHVPF